MLTNDRMLYPYRHVRPNCFIVSSSHASSDHTLATYLSSAEGLPARLRSNDESTAMGSYVRSPFKLRILILLFLTAGCTLAPQVPRLSLQHSSTLSFKPSGLLLAEEGVFAHASVLSSFNTAFAPGSTLPPAVKVIGFHLVGNFFH